MTRELAYLIEYLRKRGHHWTPAKTVQAHSRDFTGGTSWDRRAVAMYAEEADGSILSSTNGYMLDEHATEADILLAYRWIIRKAVGSELRARRIIHNARRKGLLTDDAGVRAARKEAHEEFSQRRAPDSQPGPPPNETYEDQELNETYEDQELFAT